MFILCKTKCSKVIRISIIHRIIMKLTIVVNKKETIFDIGRTHRLMLMRCWVLQHAPRMACARCKDASCRK